ncbi:RHS repeat-associated core domain-containing protein [Myxococcus sp. Y35]|uniref:RHS repeat-associated core domain-containing protein n=1 Tax=Pseudomyxococcus flavus TaxID=3115648 RepID=UPI003CF60B71
MNYVRLSTALVLHGLLIAPCAFAQTSSSLDAKVQAPELGEPQRGALAGQLASVTFGPADVSRGAFSLQAPFSYPTERGAPMGAFFPTYAVDNGLSEWGAGWQNALSFTRWRVKGSPDYITDELAGPWGRFVPGDDGYWYPSGLDSMIRLEHLGDTLIAYHSDGSRWRFGGTHRIVTPRGTWSWFLEEVVTATGRKTRFDYEANASGRMFLKMVSYGGVGDDFQHRVLLEYELLPHPFRDFRSGLELTLDRRVSAVISQTKHAVTGSFEERWRHEPTWQADELGPSFYLQSVVQRFASGQTAPPSTYTYQLATERLSMASLERVPKLDALFTSFSSDALQPNRGTLLDINEDGRIDIEHHVSNTLLVQGDDGFVYEPLPPRPPDAAWACRAPQSSFNLPRNLAQLRADGEYQVVSLQPSSLRTQTTLTVCNRLGQSLAVQTIPGDWELGANVKLVDINRDHQPDIVRVSSGEYRVLPNTSTASTYAFGAPIQGALHPVIAPNASWLHDFNGDGVPDIVSRYSGGLMVWFGLGNASFLQNGQPFELRTLSGLSLTNLSDFQLNFIDINRDGLTDILLTRISSPATILVVNTGTRFQEVSVPALASVGMSFSRPVIADFSGSGNVEVSYTRLEQFITRAYRISLDTPGTGLMRTANDGKGTVLHFEYAQSNATPGARQRQPLLSAMEIESSGHDTVRFTYNHLEPTLHTQGKFLVGFNKVTRTTSTQEHDIEFLNTDDYSGLRTKEVRRDPLTVGVYAFEQWDYEDAPFHGVNRKQLKENLRGWASDTAGHLASVEKTEYQAYAMEICPSTVKQTNEHGTLLIEKSRATVPGFGPALHCLEETIRHTGIHTDPTFDFRHEVQIARNAAGLATDVYSVTPSQPLALQHVTYSADYMISAITLPGRGTTHFEYEPDSRILREITTPDGVMTHVTQRHPLSDAILSLEKDRGAQQYTRYFRYDGLERLEKEWDNLAGSEAQPKQTYSYQYATGVAPASIFISSLIDEQDGSAQDSVLFATAAGEQVTEATRIPEGWVFDGIVERRTSVAETRTFMRSTMPSTENILALNYAGLFSGGHFVDFSRKSTFGHDVATTKSLHAGVEKQVATSLRLDAGLLHRTAWENGTLRTQVTLDASQRLVAREDEASVRHAFRYDALGRMRQVELPDGSKHQAHFDDHGRVSLMIREGVANIEYAYDPLSGLLLLKRFSSPSGVVQRQVTFTHDSAGRLESETHADFAGSAPLVYRYYHDGTSPEHPTFRTTLGLVSAIQGEGYTKRLEYRSDGLVSRRILQFHGWHTVEWLYTYAATGDVRSETMKLWSPQGPLQSSNTKSWHWNTYGQLSELYLNGQPLAILDYNENGLPTTIEFSTGGSASLGYDPLTREVTSLSQVGLNWSASTSLRLNSRGLMSHESFSLGDTHLLRQYGHSPQGFLVSAEDSQHVYNYGFDDSGLPTFIEEQEATRAFSRQGNTLMVGGTPHVFDALGRTISKGDLSLIYGPNGQIATATRPPGQWNYLYDETGQRILKLVAGIPVAGFLEGGVYLDASGLTEPLRFGGQLVGLLKNGQFQMVATDLRGTILADTDGTPRWVSPFGNRSAHPDIAAALDYTQHGYDADLGVIRMGVRDYDPTINRFLTPDPLYLESLENCSEKPVECNLYGYARNAPLNLVDPSGLDTVVLHGGGPGDASGVTLLESTVKSLLPDVRTVVPNKVHGSGWFRKDPAPAQAFATNHVHVDQSQKNLVGFSLGGDAAILATAAAGPQGASDVKWNNVIVFGARVDRIMANLEAAAKNSEHLIIVNLVGDQYTIGGGNNMFGDRKAESLADQIIRRYGSLEDFSKKFPNVTLGSAEGAHGGAANRETSMTSIRAAFEASRERSGTHTMQLPTEPSP